MMKTESCDAGLLSCKQVNTKDKDNKFVLQPLPYTERALAPYISEKTIQYHYGKHLAAYIDNTNKLKAGTEFDDLPLHEIIKNRPEVFLIIQLRYLIIISILKPCIPPSGKTYG